MTHAKPTELAMIDFANLNSLEALIKEHRELALDLQLLEGVIAHLRNRQRGIAHIRNEGGDELVKRTDAL
jgi:hypothetical protein